MSDVDIEVLQNDFEVLKNDNEKVKEENKNLHGRISDLNNQLIQNNQGVQNLLAQIEAHKQEIGLYSSNVLALRTNIILLKKSNEFLTEELKKVCQP